MSIEIFYSYTVFPRNLAAARFYFKAPFGAATIRGQLDFEGSVYRDRHARAYTASIISLYYSYARKMRVRIRKLRSIPYHAARFRGRRDFEVRRDFEEIRYIIYVYTCISTVYNCLLFQRSANLNCSCTCVVSYMYMYATVEGRTTETH